MDKPKLRDVFLDSVDEDALVSPSFFAENSLSRKQIIGNYLSQLNVFEQETANGTAKEFHKDDLPLADTVVMIPIAAHQEARNIENAMNLYAQQKPIKPFSVLLFPNAPIDADSQAIDSTLKEIENAKRTHPNLDLRSSTLNLYESPTIGTIRRTLWNSALLLAQYEGRFDSPSSEVTGINHDIDVVSMTPRYISRIQERYNNKQYLYNRLGVPGVVSPPHSTMVKHAYDPTLPNVAKGVFWADFTYRQYWPKGGFDAGAVLPFSYYADRGGFTADATVYEMKNLLNKQLLYYIPGTTLETSPRRYAKRLQASSLDNIWTKDSFDATDICRTDHKIPDISEHRLENIISQSVPNSMDTFYNNTVVRYAEKFYDARFPDGNNEELLNQFVRDLEYKKKLAVNVLRRVINVPFIADRVDRLYDTRECAERLLTNDFSDIRLLDDDTAAQANIIVINDD